MIDKSQMSNARKMYLTPFYCLALGTYNCSLIVEPEFFYHLTLGNWIYAHRTLPATDLWINPPDRPLIASHWLFQLYLSRIETSWGWHGIAVAKLVLCSLTVLAMFFLFRSTCRSDFFAAVVAMFVSCGLLERAPFGPQLVAWPIFAGILLAVSKGRAILSGVLAIALTNIDPGWALAALFSAAVFWPKHWPALAALSCGLLFSPFLWWHLLAALRDMLAVMQDGMRLKDVGAITSSFAFAFLLLSWVLLVMLMFGRPRTSLFRRVLVVAGLTSLGSLIVSPLQSFALILTGFALALIWIERAAERPIVIAIESFSSKLAALPTVGVVWVFFCLIVVNTVNFYHLPVLTALLPVREVDYLLEHDLPEPLWHEPEIRPYLVYRFSGPDGSPQRLVSSGERADAATLLVRNNSESFRKLDTDKRYEVVSTTEHTPEAEDQLRQLPQFWGLFRRKIEPQAIL